MADVPEHGDMKISEEGMGHLKDVWFPPTGLASGEAVAYGMAQSGASKGAMEAVRDLTPWGPLTEDFVDEERGVSKLFRLGPLSIFLNLFAQNGVRLKTQAVEFNDGYIGLGTFMPSALDFTQRCLPVTLMQIIPFLQDLRMVTDAGQLEELLNPVGLWNQIKHLKELTLIFDRQGNAVVLCRWLWKASGHTGPPEKYAPYFVPCGAVFPGLRLAMHSGQATGDEERATGVMHVTVYNSVPSQAPLYNILEYPGPSQIKDQLRLPAMISAPGRIYHLFARPRSNGGLRMEVDRVSIQREEDGYDLLMDWTTALRTGRILGQLFMIGLLEKGKENMVCVAVAVRWITGKKGTLDGTSHMLQPVSFLGAVANQVARFTTGTWYEKVEGTRTEAGPTYTKNQETFDPTAMVNWVNNKVSLQTAMAGAGVDFDPSYLNQCLYARIKSIFTPETAQTVSRMGEGKSLPYVVKYGKDRPFQRLRTDADAYWPPPDDENADDVMVARFVKETQARDHEEALAQKRAERKDKKAKGKEKEKAAAEEAAGPPPCKADFDSIYDKWVEGVSERLRERRVAHGLSPDGEPPEGYWSKFGDDFRRYALQWAEVRYYCKDEGEALRSFNAWLKAQKVRERNQRRKDRKDETEQKEKEQAGSSNQHADAEEPQEPEDTEDVIRRALDEIIETIDKSETVVDLVIAERAQQQLELLLQEFVAKRLDAEDSERKRAAAQERANAKANQRAQIEEEKRLKKEQAAQAALEKKQAEAAEKERKRAEWRAQQAAEKGAAAANAQNAAMAKGKGKGKGKAPVQGRAQGRAGGGGRGRGRGYGY